MVLMLLYGQYTQKQPNKPSIKLWTIQALSTISPQLTVLRVMQIHRYMNLQELVSFEKLRQCDFYGQQYQMYTVFCANTLIAFCL
jgi:hypothetical protein